MSYDMKKQENARRIREYKLDPNSGTVIYYPAYIQLEHTSLCNAQCIMCNHFYIGNRGSRDISERVAEKLEPILPYCQSIMLNGDGEPFLCHNIERYIKLYHKYGIRVGTNTNLCALSPDMISSLGEAIDYLNISCDGCNKETFEKIRRGLDYDRFIENLKQLNAKAPQIRKNLDCVLMVQNIFQTPGLVTFAAEFGFDSVKFNMLGVNPCIGNESDSLTNYPNAAAYYLQQAAKKAEELDIEIIYPDVFRRDVDENRLEIERHEILSYDWSVIEARKVICENKYPNVSLENDYLNKKVTVAMLSHGVVEAPEPCQWGLERCYIDLSGNVSTCCYNVHHYMGNILEVDSFDDIWNGPAYQEFRMRMAKGYLPEWCRECGYYWGKIRSNFTGMR